MSDKMYFKHRYPSGLVLTITELPWGKFLMTDGKTTLTVEKSQVKLHDINQPLKYWLLNVGDR